MPKLIMYLFAALSLNFAMPAHAAFPIRNITAQHAYAYKQSPKNNTWKSRERTSGTPSILCFTAGLLSYFFVILTLFMLWAGSPLALIILTGVLTFGSSIFSIIEGIKAINNHARLQLLTTFGLLISIPTLIATALFALGLLMGL